MCNDLMTEKKLSTSNAAALNPMQHEVVLVAFLGVFIRCNFSRRPLDTR